MQLFVADMMIQQLLNLAWLTLELQRGHSNSRVARDHDAVAKSVSSSSRSSHSLVINIFDTDVSAPKTYLGIPVIVLLLEHPT